MNKLNKKAFKMLSTAVLFHYNIFCSAERLEDQKVIP